MRKERGKIFGPLGAIEGNVAIALGFGEAPSFGIPEELGKGHIYHVKPWGRENIVVASAVLRGERWHSFFLRTFDGLSPLDMSLLSPEEAKRQHEIFMSNVLGAISPEFKVTQNDLKTRLQELAMKW